MLAESSLATRGWCGVSPVSTSGASVNERKQPRSQREINLANDIYVTQRQELGEWYFDDCPDCLNRLTNLFVGRSPSSYAEGGCEVAEWLSDEHVMFLSDSPPNYGGWLSIVCVVCTLV